MWMRKNGLPWSKWTEWFHCNLKHKDETVFPCWREAPRRFHAPCSFGCGGPNFIDNKKLDVEWFTTSVIKIKFWLSSLSHCHWRHKSRRKKNFFEKTAPGFEPGAAKSKKRALPLVYQASWTCFIVHVKGHIHTASKSVSKNLVYSLILFSILYKFVQFIYKINNPIQRPSIHSFSCQAVWE